MKIETIFDLSADEKKWWGVTIKQKRNELVRTPEFYAEYAYEALRLSTEQVKQTPSDVIESLRETAWHRHLEDECVFHKEIITFLVENRDIPRDILAKLYKANIANKYTNLTKEELFKKMTLLVGEYAGRIMPYLYALSLSTTNSRRSRAGKTFERVIEKILTILDYPFANQARLGNKFYSENGIGKIVDAVIPSADGYASNRAKCALLTMKTTLRERWQEVVEELQRTNLPHIFLLTVDGAITQNVAATLKSYNITIVVYDEVKKKKFASFDNVKGYEKFFAKELPHYISYWQD